MVHVSYTNIRTSCKLKNESIKTLKTFVTFFDNKLSIHFGEDKAKTILFASKQRAKNMHQLNTEYKNIYTKQHILDVCYTRPCPESQSH